jgi:hypothetical protein
MGLRDPGESAGAPADGAARDPDGMAVDGLDDGALDRRVSSAMQPPATMTTAARAIASGVARPPSKRRVVER